MQGLVDGNVGMIWRPRQLVVVSQACNGIDIKIELITATVANSRPPWTQKDKEDYQNKWDDFHKLSTAHMNCEYNAMP